MQGTHLVIYMSSRRICFYPFTNDVSTFDTITTGRYELHGHDLHKIFEIFKKI